MNPHPHENVMEEPSLDHQLNISSILPYRKSMKTLLLLADIILKLYITK